MTFASSNPLYPASQSGLKPRFSADRPHGRTGWDDAGRNGYHASIPTRSADFLKYRAPKFLDYFERVIEQAGRAYLLGRALSYADLSLFQVIDGLRYAFPNAMPRIEGKVPGCVALHERVANRPRIAAYLASERRIAFSQWGIYRYFPELDG